ncbi:hypothetical protein ACNKHV_07485 [Shigella flexneri]
MTDDASWIKHYCEQNIFLTRHAFAPLIDACWERKVYRRRVTVNLIAGITVGIIAIPLAMALAIGSGA